MVVVYFVGTTDQHDDETLSVIKDLVANRRSELVMALLDPLGGVQGWYKVYVPGSQGYGTRVGEDMERMLYS